MNELYVLIDWERTIGTGCVHYWNVSLFGYTADPSEAGEFTLSEAQEHCQNDINGDTILLPLKKIKEHARLK